MLLQVEGLLGISADDLAMLKEGDAEKQQQYQSLLKKVQWQDYVVRLQTRTRSEYFCTASVVCSWVFLLLEWCSRDNTCFFERHRSPTSTVSALLSAAAATPFHLVVGNHQNIQSESHGALYCCAFAVLTHRTILSLAVSASICILRLSCIWFHDLHQYDLAYTCVIVFNNGSCCTCFLCPRCALPWPY